MDSYPTVITRRDGRLVPVVQAYAFGKYLGRLDVTFDRNGHAVSWNGNPIILDNSVPRGEEGPRGKEGPRGEEGPSC